METGAPNLTTWLDSQGFSEQVAEALKPFGVTSPKHLTLLPPDDLKEVIQSLNLQRVEQIKLTLAIRIYESEEGHRVVLTPTEDASFKKLISLAQKAQGFLKEIQGAMSSTEKHASEACKGVNETFDKLSKNLIERKKNLLAEIKAKKKEKLDALQKQSLEVSEIIAQYSQARADSERLLKITSLDALPDREGRIRESIAGASALKLTTELSKEPEFFFRANDKDAVIAKSIKEYGKITPGAAVQPHPTIKTVTSTATTIKVEWCPVLEQQQDIPPALQYDIRVTESEQKCAEGELANVLNNTFDKKESSCVLSNLKKNTNYSVHARTMNENGWGSFGEASVIKTKEASDVKPKALDGIPPEEWMETGDQAKGFKPLWGSSTVFLAVSKINQRPSQDKLEQLITPNGYHWASYQEVEGGNFQAGGVVHTYYNTVGWNCYTFNGVARHYFVFRDSETNTKIIHCGQRANQFCNYPPTNKAHFAGLICIKD